MTPRAPQSWERWSPWAWPGTVGAGITMTVMLGHLAWRSHWETDLFTIVCFVLTLVSLTLCLFGTLGRIDAERRR